MNNKEFEDKELNHMHKAFYLQSVINLHAAFVMRGNLISTAREYAIQQSQQLMRDMGYTNPVGDE